MECKTKTAVFALSRSYCGGWLNSIFGQLSPPISLYWEFDLKIPTSFMYTFF